MKKLVMFVYSDIKTDARVMRTVKALKNTYELTLLATTTNRKASDLEGYEFIDVVDRKITNPLLRYMDCLKKVFKLIRMIKPDIVYGHDYYAAPVVALGKKRISYIYDAHELYVADKNSSKREKVCCLFEKKAIENSELVVCASNRRRNIMKEIYSTKREIVVVDNISLLPRNTLSETTLQKAQILDKFLCDDRKTVVYCGALIKARKVENLIYAAKQLEDKIKVLIIGGGEEKSRLQEIQATENVNNCLFLDSVPYKDIWALISRCDIGYLYYENDTLNNKNCAPNKIYEYASAGLPMIANNNPGLKDVFVAHNIGAASEDTCEAIIQVINEYDKYKENLSGFLSDCSWEKECKRLLIAIRESCE